MPIHILLILLLFTDILSGCSSSPSKTCQPPECSQTEEKPKRLALVIGNSQYWHISDLKKVTTKDANDMTNSLQKLGFTVFVVNDAKRQEMYDAIDRFNQKIDASGDSTVALFFFAGHGVQVGEEIHLFPTSYRTGDETQKDDKDKEMTVTGSYLGKTLVGEDNPAGNIFIFNVCREVMPSGETQPLYLPKRTVIAFAIQEGSFAGMEIKNEKDLENTPYTRHLLQSLLEPGLSILDVFKTVAKPTIWGEDRKDFFDNTYLAGKGFEGGVDKW